MLCDDFRRSSNHRSNVNKHLACAGFFFVFWIDGNISQNYGSVWYTITLSIECFATKFFLGSFVRLFLACRLRCLFYADNYLLEESNFWLKIPSSLYYALLMTPFWPIMKLVLEPKNEATTNSYWWSYTTVNILDSMTIKWQIRNHVTLPKASQYVITAHVDGTLLIVYTCHDNRNKSRIYLNWHRFAMNIYFSSLHSFGRRMVGEVRQKIGI